MKVSTSVASLVLPGTATHCGSRLPGTSHTNSSLCTNSCRLKYRMATLQRLEMQVAHCTSRTPSGLTTRRGCTCWRGPLPGRPAPTAAYSPPTAPRTAAWCVCHVSIGVQGGVLEDLPIEIILPSTTFGMFMCRLSTAETFRHTLARHHWRSGALQQ